METTPVALSFNDELQLIAELRQLASANPETNESALETLDDLKDDLLKFPPERITSKLKSDLRLLLQRLKHEPQGSLFDIETEARVVLQHLAEKGEGLEVRIAIAEEMTGTYVGTCGVADSLYYSPAGTLADSALFGAKIGDRRRWRSTLCGMVDKRLEVLKAESDYIQMVLEARQGEALARDRLSIPQGVALTETVINQALNQTLEDHAGRHHNTLSADKRAAERLLLLLTYQESNKEAQ